MSYDVAALAQRAEEGGARPGAGGYANQEPRSVRRGGRFGAERGGDPGGKRKRSGGGAGQRPARCAAGPPGPQRGTDPRHGGRPARRGGAGGPGGRGAGRVRPPQRPAPDQADRAHRRDRRDLRGAPQRDGGQRRAVPEKRQRRDPARRKRGHSLKHGHRRCPARRHRRGGPERGLRAA